MADDFGRQLADLLYGSNTAPEDKEEQRRIAQLIDRERLRRLGGAAETAATIGSGILSSVPAGLAGLASMLPTRGRGPDLNKAVERVEQVQQAGTYIPRGETGQRYLEKTAGALEVLGAPAEYLGEKTLQYTGSPGAATAVSVLGDPVNLIGTGLPTKAARAGVQAIKAAPRVAGDILSSVGTGPTAGSRAAQLGAVSIAPEIPEFKPQGFLGLLSRADEAVAALPRQKGTGAEFLRELQKTPGVKPAELEDRGLIDALSGLGKVTKADVLKVLQENPPVKLEERILGQRSLDDAISEAQNIENKQVLTLLQRAKFMAEREGTRGRGTANLLNRARQPQANDLPPGDRGNYLDFDALDAAKDLMSVTEEPKFGKYALPGGENYREILLTLPSSRPSIKSMGRREYDEAVRRADEQGIQDYTSPHWEQPNVLAHARISDRTGPNGERILHVEEVQSDWHQDASGERRKQIKELARSRNISEEEARKLVPEAYGYKTGKEKEQISALSKQYDELTKRRDQLAEQGVGLQYGSPEYIRIIDEASAITPQLMRLQEQMDSLRLAGQRGVPDAPFKKNWHELMMRRLVDYAAKNGYDRIAITPGAEQASRYDLSKHIDKVLYSPYGDGTFEVSAVLPNGQEFGQVAGRKTIKEIEQTFGKEIAEKMVKGEKTAEESGVNVLSGSGLQVGGEGMKGFYDKILPTYLNELGKPYGVKVGQTDVITKRESRGVNIMTPDEPEIYPAQTMKVHSFDITPQMREAIKSKGLPLYAKGGRVHISDNPDTMALELAVGGAVAAAKAAAKAAEKAAAKKAAEKAAEQPAFTAKQLQSTAEKMAEKLKADNPKLTDDEAMKKGLRLAEQKLKWEKAEKPELEKTYGALEKSKFSDPLARRQRNVPEVVEKRIKETQEFLKEPTEPWTPPRKELQAFERERIKEALEGFPGIEQTKFPRYEPARADLGYIDEIYDDPINRELIKGQIKRGLPLGGETFYASLYPLKLAALERGIPESKFNEFIYSIAPASARNSIMNEMAVGQFMRDMRARGLSLDEDTVKQEMAAFKQKYGTGLPLMPVHREGVRNVLEGGQDLREMLKADIPTNYKIPTYGTQKAGDFAKSMVLDVHESAGQTRGSRYHPYFTEQGGFGPTEYGAAENKMLDIAGEMGIPGGMAQAGRWFGGGELTGLKSPRGDALDLLEKQTAYTLQGMGIKPTPHNIRNYVLDMIEKGEGVLMPWFKKEGMPDVRTEKKKGGAVKKPRKVSFTDNLDTMRLAVQKRK